MLLVKTDDKGKKVVQYPYTNENLWREFPQLSKRHNLTAAQLARRNLYPVQRGKIPNHHPCEHDVVELKPKLIDGAWVRQFKLKKVTKADQAKRIEKFNLMQLHRRRQMYPNHADPVFFQWQRGECTEQEYLAAVQAVKDKYPYWEPKK